MNKPLISIIIPCYNQGKYLSDTLLSVFQQTYKNWECIIVNDGSTDNSEEIALEWCAKDKRFYYVKKENGGLSSARNMGLKIVKGEYIQFLDSDDLLDEKKFENKIQLFNNKVDIVICDYFPFEHLTRGYCAYRYMNPFPEINKYKEQIILKWEKELSIPCHCILFKSILLNQYKSMTFDEFLPNHEDWSFWVKLFYFSKGIANIRESLVSYRIHSESMCNDVNKMKNGFILACKSNILFFYSINDNSMARLCEKKLKYVLIGNIKGIKASIYTFIPLLALLYGKKLVDYFKQR